MSKKMRIVLEFNMHSCVCDASELNWEPTIFSIPMPLIASGYRGVIFKKCDVNIDDIAVATSWKPHIDNGDIFFITDCSIDGGFADEAAVTRAMGCDQDEKVLIYKRNYTLNIRADKDNVRWLRLEELSRFENLDKYEISFIDCDGTMYNFFKPGTLQVNATKGANISEESLYVITASVRRDILDFTPLAIKLSSFPTINPSTPVTPPVTPE